MQPAASAPRLRIGQGDAQARAQRRRPPIGQLDLQRVFGLVESVVGSSSAEYQKAKPYLETFGAVVAGAKDEGDGVSRSRFVVTLK